MSTRGTTLDSPVGAEHDPAAERLTALIAAFQALRRPGLRVEVRFSPSSALDDEVSVVVTLRTRPGGALSTLSLLTFRGELATRSSPEDARFGLGLIRDLLPLRLQQGFSWGDADFASAEDMAEALVACMAARLDAVDPPGPARYARTAMRGRRARRSLAPRAAMSGRHKKPAAALPSDVR